jgi:hypothetical protein
MRYSKGDFSLGEISPSIYGRPELPQYLAGAKVMKNMLPLPTGGACNRPGTKYIGTVKASGTKWRLVSFIYSDGDAYVLEFGEYYIRFFKGDAPVLLSPGVPYEVVTTWASTSLANLKFTQSADVIFICDGTSQQRLLTRYSDAVWTLTTYDYINGPYMLENSTSTTITPSGTSTTPKVITGITKAAAGVVTSAGHGFNDGDVVYISGVVGMVEVNNLAFKVRNKATDTFELDYNHAGASLNTSTYTTYSSGGTVQKVVTLTATANQNIFSNVTGQTHSAGRALWRINHWIQAQIYNAAITTVIGTAIRCGGTWRIKTHGTWTGNVNVEVSDDGVNFTTSRIFVSFSDSNFDTYVTETFASQFWVRTNSILVSGSGNVELSTDPFEWVGVARTVCVPAGGGGGTSQMYNTADAVILTPLGDTTATKIWAEGSWSDYRGYPAALAFFQDRLTFAGSESEPDTVWCSKSGNYYDYGVSFPIQDDDGISVRIPSRELNKIRNLVQINKLAVLTSSGLFTIEPGDSGVLSPKTISIKAHDLAGSSAVTPVVVNDRVVYSQSLNRILRDSGYDFDTDGFQGINLNANADHIFKEYTVVEMAYQREPWQTIWVVRSDGCLCSLTYIKQLEVYGWARHFTHSGKLWSPLERSTDDAKSTGQFLSVCSVPGTEIDDIYVIAKRTTSSLATLITIEKFTNRNASIDPEQQVFLDCSFEVDTPITVSGITKATTGVVTTATAHGFSDGDQVDIRGAILYPLTLINGVRFTAKNPTTYTFELYVGAIPYSTVSMSQEISYGTVRKAIGVVTGLDALDTVSVLSVLANGYPLGLTAIISGSGNLSTGYKASILQIGFPYVSELETPDVCFQTTAGSTQGKMADIKTASVMLRETYGGKIGSNRVSGIADVKEMTNFDGSKLHKVLVVVDDIADVSPSLFSGIFEQTISSGADRARSIIIRQEDPYPITILSIDADVTVGS